jgi:hypothetical protein
MSGAQTGVDRAALDAAISAGLRHGGFVPKGRRAEDGRIPNCYRVYETDSDKYPVRTRLNIEKSTVTLILTRPGHFGKGVALTQKIARELSKPVKVVLLDNRANDQIVAEIIVWLLQMKPLVLNVAGPRENRCRGIHKRALVVLTRAFSAWCERMEPKTAQERLLGDGQ